MSEPAVNWHEGMFLRPHHFQAAGRYFNDQLRQSGRWDVHYNWGLRTIDIDQAALANYQFVVHRLEARLRDGTIVRVPEDGALTPIDLRAGLEQQNPLEVSLAIPAVQMGRANTGPETDGTRFRAYSPRDGVPDENFGQNPRPVQFRVLNLRLVSGAQDTAGYEVLPIARVARSARAEAVPELHEPYIPPMLAFDAWPVLQRDIIQQVYHRVAKLVEQRASQVRSRRITFDSQSPGDRQIFESLRVLNEAAAYLSVMGDAAGVHPLPAYLELCRLVGRLAIFGPDAKPPELPRYDHDDLGGCFFSVKRYIDDLLTHGGFSLGYEERPFVGEGLRMKVTMEPAWLAPAWQIFIGVESPLPTADLVPLLTGRLNMKIGSIERVDEIFQRGLRGLAFAYNPKPPRALPESRTLTYFQINRDVSPEEWQNIQNSLAIAIRLNERAIAGNIDGQNVVTIRTEGLTTALQFTLYV
ncbi:MAG TPA: type VI secretion system baseplate subunit TssK, partial [Gemmataceae bacterium]|nr:type VI secretion system baseplate subunit TssK [Gemmataceae bacterium]